MESKNTTKSLELSEYNNIQHQSSLLSIIRKEYDELVFSNILAFLFEQNRNVFVDFVSEVLNISNVKVDFEISREKEHIDLWIEDENTVIVIENKIKSKINGERHDIDSEKVQSQLKKYYDYANKECPNKNRYFFIFTPDYNSMNLDKYETGNIYKIIKYGQIYDYYIRNAGKMLHIPYFVEFIDAMRLHTLTLDNSNFEIMKSRFVSKIKQIKSIDS